MPASKLKGNSIIMTEESGRKSMSGTHMICIMTFYLFFLSINALSYTIQFLPNTRYPNKNKKNFPRVQALPNSGYR
jgi:hypothetical protein